VALLIALALVPAALAESAELQAAVDLFGKQEYVAAQEALLKVDRATLSEAELKRLDELLKLVPEAIKGSEKAAQDLAAANKAYEAGQWDAADKLYQAVADNEYARKKGRADAATQRERIVEKKKLAEAAKPSGAVEGAPVAERTTVTQQTAPPPTPETTPPAAEQKPAEQPAPEAPRRLTPTEELLLREALLWQRAVAQAEAAAAKAREAMANKDFTEARKLADTALQMIEAAKGYAEPISKYQAAKNAVLTLKQELAQAADEFDRLTAAEQQKEIAARVATRRRLLEQQKQEKVQQLFNAAGQLRKEHRFREAAEALREILRIDPANAKAREQLEVVEDYESIAQQADWQRDVYVQQRGAIVNAEEALIPWDVDVLYPKNWLELTSQRTMQGIASSGHEKEDSELNRQLGEVIPEVRFDETPFEQVMEFLTELTKINMAVDWTDLTDNGVAKDKPVTVRLTNLTLKVVLKELLTQVGGETVLAYSVGDGLIRIATKAKLDKDKFVLIYDIRDLIVNVRNVDRQGGFDVGQAMQQTGQQGGGGSSGLFGQQGQQQQQQYGPNQQGQTNALVTQIMDIIRQTVEPDSWRETGGGDGSIRELSGQLIIYNTSDAHRQVVDLLTQLRETRALQISVECRFLNVVSNFLEQFGVDLDFVFNSGSAGYDRVTAPTGGELTDPFTGAPVLVSRPYSRIGEFATPPGLGTPFGTPVIPQQPYGQAAFVPRGTGISPHFSEMTPITAQQGTMSLVDSSAINTGVPGSWAQRAALQPALNIAGSFLDNLQVDFLIRATQANARSSVVQAPRLVLFNGQSAAISVGRSHDYVSSLQPRVAEGAVAFQPVLGNAASGNYMNVEGTISADRRYVTLTLWVQQMEEPSFERFEIQRASGNSPGAFLMLRDQRYADLQTTVSVPDGGTVLLGGLKQVGEVELEAGVPVLSKIPVLNRAFTNRTQVKDTRTLLILIKAKIIIQKEAEDEAFPTFSRTGG
jgi:type II secretory pathway component GspD/PulD (secretin)